MKAERSRTPPAHGAVRIRPATSADLPALVAMFEELAAVQQPWRVFAVRGSLPNEMRVRYRDALGDPEAVLLVAEEDSTIVGMAEGSVVRPSTLSDELAVELSSAYVRPSHRGRGVARALTARIARFARRHGITRVTLKTFAQNDEAIAAWSSLGFETRSVQMTAPVDRLDGGPAYGTDAGGPDPNGPLRPTGRAQVVPAPQRGIFRHLPVFPAAIAAAPRIPVGRDSGGSWAGPWTV